MPSRWEGDDRGRGVADARQLTSGVSELSEAFNEPAWVAEDPGLHLLPHVEAWCERDERLSLREARADELGGYVLALAWHGSRGSVGAARAAVFSLIGQFAESATYVRQRRLNGDGERDGLPMLRFEVGTGELGSDAGFAPHGHVVIIDVSDVL